MKNRGALVMAALMLSACSIARGAPGAQPTSYTAMAALLYRYQSQCSLMHISVIGVSAKLHHRLLMVRIGAPRPDIPNIMALCRQHGDEPSGTEGALAFIGDLVRSLKNGRSLKSACVYIVPMVNPDGADAETRRSGDGADLNRDWGVFRQPESRAVQIAVARVHPQFILDIHSWDSSDRFQQVCLEGPRDSQVIGEKMLSSIAYLQARAAYGVAASSGQTVAATTYGDSAQDTLAHRYFLRSDHIASLLFETAPGPNEGASLQARSRLVQTLLNWLLTDTSLHPDAWRRLAEAEPARERIATPAREAAHAAPIAVRVERAVAWRLGLSTVAAFLLVLWTVLFKKRVESDEPVCAPPRVRRLAGTWYAHLHCEGRPGLKERRRNTAQRPDLFRAAPNEPGELAVRYRVPDTAGTR